jgi:Tol biopolymer transport system component
LTTHGALLEGFAGRYLTWSPDDKELAFASSTERDGEHASLYIIGANGAHRQRVFAG